MRGRGELSSRWWHEPQSREACCGTECENFVVPPSCTAAGSGRGAATGAGASRPKAKTQGSATRHSRIRRRTRGLTPFDAEARAASVRSPPPLSSLPFLSGTSVTVYFPTASRCDCGAFSAPRLTWHFVQRKLGSAAFWPTSWLSHFLVLASM